MSVRCHRGQRTFGELHQAPFSVISVMVRQDLAEGDFELPQSDGRAASNIE
jgi:hypothetical protein